MQLVQKVEVTQGQHGYILMSNCFPSFIDRWILNFVDQPTHKNHVNWYPTNKSDFTGIGKGQLVIKQLVYCHYSFT